MKKTISVFALFICLFNCTAQVEDTKQKGTIPVTDTAKKASDTSGAFRKVEIESEFPGGPQGWANFLQQNLFYPKKAVRKRIEGTVVLQFIVCTDGAVCDVQAISGPEELRQAAVDAMKKTPNWKPAFQDGKNVKSYKKQPIEYRLQPL